MVIELPEVALEELAIEHSALVAVQYRPGCPHALEQQAAGRFRRWDEQVHGAPTRPIAAAQTALAIAAAGGLRNRIQSRKSTVDHRKVDIDTGLDQLSAHETNRPQVGSFALCGEAPLDLVENGLAMGAAHQRGKVKSAGRQQRVQVARIAPAVDHDERGVLLRDFAGQGRPRRRRRKIGGSAHLHALQLREQRIGVGDDLDNAVQAAEVRGRVEVARGGQRGLGGSTQHDGRAVVPGEQMQGVEDRLHERGRQLLRFVQHDHAVDEVVQLAAARGARGKQRLEQLHIGGDDERRIPVFAGEPAGCGFVLRVRLRLAVVLH